MTADHPVLRVGLTGGIASGKTTVAQMFSELGALVVDADEIAHRVVAAGGPAYERVVARFGRAILDDRGEVVRSRLGRLVFDDSTARAALNAIVHPEVRAEADRRIADYAGAAPVALFDAALLVETGAYRDFDRVIVVRCASVTLTDHRASVCYHPDK